MTAFNPGTQSPMGPAVRFAVPDYGGQGVDLGTVALGSIATNIMEMVVWNQTGWENGAAVPNIGVELIQNDPDTPLNVRCANGGAEGTVLTDAQGHAWCDIQEITQSAGMQYFKVDFGSGGLGYFQGVKLTFQ